MSAVLLSWYRRVLLRQSRAKPLAMGHKEAILLQREKVSPVSNVLNQEALSYSKNEL